MSRAITVYYPAPTKSLTKDEVAALFAKLGKDSPIWGALRQIIQERTADTMGALTDQRLSAEQLTRAAGRLEELLSLHGELAGYIEPRA